MYSFLLDSVEDTRASSAQVPRNFPDLLSPVDDIILSGEQKFIYFRCNDRSMKYVNFI